MIKQVVCSQCHRTNRVPEERMGDKPLCGACKQPVLANHPIELSDQSFLKQITQNELPVVVDFWAPWCGPCKMMAPEFAKAAQGLHTRVIFAKVNTEEESRIASQFGIRSIPTLIVFKGEMR